MREVSYRSGEDVVLEFVGQRFAFSRRDFAERALAAGRILGLVGTEAGAAERADVVELTTTGSLATPRSPLGRALHSNASSLGEVSYWLRKLVFRRAWVDVRVDAGLLTAEFDEASGTFRHRHGGYDVPPALLDDVPRFAFALEA